MVFTMLVYLKDGLENTGGLGVPLFFLSPHLAYLPHCQALSESVSLYLFFLCLKALFGALLSLTYIE